ncbi:PepSY-associated TM helix domain-containing protein [Aliarcobacter lanthieri]|uniref:PepSY-associated TM helix domain-containing protein n=1 Tax=Aliarcobacter lanthieri TaxID=1355374 RepID=UPI00047AB0FF|nr:PepSY-associated TM helix domain-containing protein [Aliarcobacter lanthieri]QKF59935.1 PepSY domain-containing membrane protein [Aliarcobacter lanthieri]
MIERLSKQEEKRLFNQRLQRVHVAIGISFSFLMYIALFFGIFAILLPYINNWEKPITHIKMTNTSTIDYDKILNQVLEDSDFPKNNPITISLPGYMKDPTLKVSTQFVEPKIFDPNTTLELKKDDGVFELANFLNYLHYGRLFGEFGWYIFGFMAVAGVFLIVGGLIQIIIINYRDSTSSQTGTFSKWHRKILLWTIAPFLIIVISGVFMNLGKKTAPLMTTVATKGEIKEVGKFIFPAIHPQDPKIEKIGEVVEMLSINELLKKAQSIAPELNFYRIKLTNWQDSTSVVKFEGYNPYMPFLNGLSNLPNVILSGVDGSLISEQKVLDKRWGSIFYDTINYIHLLFSVDDITRMVVFFIMLITTLAIGFGNLLYLEKRARKFPTNIPVYQGFGKLSLAVMLGVIPATGVLFVLQWLLPLDMENKVLITKGLFATFWCFTFTYSFYRLNSYQTAKEFLYLGGILFILSSIIHFINSGFNPIRLLNEGVYVVLAMDIGLILFGLILLIIAYKLPIQRDKIQEFWTSRGVK